MLFKWLKKVLCRDNAEARSRVAASGEITSAQMDYDCSSKYKHSDVTRSTQIT